MKLKKPDQQLEEWLAEFDVWITPFITDIRTTKRFQDELLSIKECLDVLDSAFNGFVDGLRPKPEAITVSFIPLVKSKIRQAAPGIKLEEIAFQSLIALSSLLFLVTGKSDNNHKCQFPLYLKNQVGIQALPTRKRRKSSKYVFVDEAIPRVLDSQSYMNRIADLLAASESMDALSIVPSYDQIAGQLLNQLIGFVLSDEASLTQLISIVQSYSNLKRSGGNPDALLTPLVVFQVRGSVSASGGHEPENILRRRMLEWGLRPDVDFNLRDVILGVEAGRLVEVSTALQSAYDEDEDHQEEPTPKRREKTRAYDFVLPFRVDGWPPRIFIQSQFYAGDSGSVSHKNVDQTDTSRANALTLIKKAWPHAPEPAFLEYVDGAGYASSLYGDLYTLLSKPSTKNFFQIRSAAIRLRQEIQEIGFLTPIEIAHAVITASHSEEDAKKLLLKEGYGLEEIERSFAISLQSSFLSQDDTGNVTIGEERLDAVRRYMLLDVVANNGEGFESIEEAENSIIVPGYGPYYGVKADRLAVLAAKQSQAFWGQSDRFMSDLCWLLDQGFVIWKQSFRGHSG